MAALQKDTRSLTSRGARHGLVAALALSLGAIGIMAARDQRQHVGCPLLIARLDSSNGGALVVEMCATLPAVGAVIIRYDLMIHISLANGVNDLSWSTRR